VNLFLLYYLFVLFLLDSLSNLLSLGFMVFHLLFLLVFLLLVLVLVLLFLLPHHLLNLSLLCQFQTNLNLLLNLYLHNSLVIVPFSYYLLVFLAVPFGFSFLVSLFLLPCTSGPYIVIIGMLGQKVTHAVAIKLLLLYNLIFILPMILISMGTYWGLNIQSLPCEE